MLRYQSHPAEARKKPLESPSQPFRPWNRAALPATGVGFWAAAEVGLGVDFQCLAGAAGAAVCLAAWAVEARQVQAAAFEDSAARWEAAADPVDWAAGAVDFPSPARPSRQARSPRAETTTPRLPTL